VTIGSIIIVSADCSVVFTRNIANGIGAVDRAKKKVFFHFARWPHFACDASQLCGLGYARITDCCPTYTARHSTASGAYDASETPRLVRTAGSVGMNFHNDIFADGAVENIRIIVGRTDNSTSITDSCYRGIAVNRKVAHVASITQIPEETALVRILGDGEIVERGTFQELMELNGSFARVYNVQQAQQADALTCKTPTKIGGDNNG
jgi:hypothetical protein